MRERERGRKENKKEKFGSFEIISLCGNLRVIKFEGKKETLKLIRI